MVSLEVIPLPFLSRLCVYVRVCACVCACVCVHMYVCVWGGGLCFFIITGVYHASNFHHFDDVLNLRIHS